MKKKQTILFWTTVIFTALVQIYPFFSSLFDLRSHGIIPQAFYDRISFFHTISAEVHVFRLLFIGIFAFIFFGAAIIYAKRYSDKIFYVIGLMSIITFPIMIWFDIYLDAYLFNGACVLFPLLVYALLIIAVVLKSKKQSEILDF